MPDVQEVMGRSEPARDVMFPIGNLVMAFIAGAALGVASVWLLPPSPPPPLPQRLDVTDVMSVINTLAPLADRRIAKYEPGRTITRPEVDVSVYGDGSVMLSLKTKNRSTLHGHGTDLRAAIDNMATSSEAVARALGR